MSLLLTTDAACDQQMATNRNKREMVAVGVLPCSIVTVAEKSEEIMNHLRVKA